MATFTNTSRYKRARQGKFRDSTVVYPKYINYSRIAFVGSQTITAKTEFRPDLISIEAYRRNDLGWIIMAANKIDDVSELFAGRVIQIPQTEGVLAK